MSFYGEFYAIFSKDAIKRAKKFANLKNSSIFALA